MKSNYIWLSRAQWCGLPLKTWPKIAPASPVHSVIRSSYRRYLGAETKLYYTKSRCIIYHRLVKSQPEIQKIARELLSSVGLAREKLIGVMVTYYTAAAADTADSLWHSWIFIEHVQHSSRPGGRGKRLKGRLDCCIIRTRYMLFI